MAAEEFDLNNLFADFQVNEADLQAADVQSKGVLAELAEQLTGSGGSSPEWRMRSCKPTSEQFLTWFVPNTDIKEVPSEVHAVRGVPVGIFYGMSLFNSQTKSTDCRTVAIAPNADPEKVYFNGLGPLSKNLYNGVAYQEENVPSRDILAMNPWGSRGFSCAECIRNGLHQHTYMDKQSKEQTDRCGGSISVLMLVTALAVSKTNLKQRTRTIEWQDVTAVKDSDGNQIYSGPFILHVSFRAGSANWKGDMTLKCEPADPTPANLQSWTKFYEELVKAKQVTDTFQDGTDIGHLMANAVVEMWAAKPVDAQLSKYITATVKSLVGFRQVPDDTAIALGSSSFPYGQLKGTVLMGKAMAAFYEGYRQEYISLGGKLDETRKLLRQVPSTAVLDGDKEQDALAKVLTEARTPAANTEAVPNVNPFGEATEGEQPALKSADPDAIEVEAKTVETPAALQFFSRSQNGAGAN